MKKTELKKPEKKSSHGQPQRKARERIVYQANLREKEGKQRFIRPSVEEKAGKREVSQASRDGKGK